MKTQSPDMRALLASIVELIISLNFSMGVASGEKGCSVQNQINPAAREMLQMTEAEICQVGRNSLVHMGDPRLPPC